MLLKFRLDLKPRATRTDLDKCESDENNKDDDDDDGFMMLLFKRENWL